ncbi:hypothetical protein FB567DRAFT_552056 [Paraphoma chrysanthemicola]|uniref:Uncharacterized protein n=1 Tax=Paraphoma chrysanthemicola TaxID=798071 RepID=A0A8K0VVC2_9PLEO|nr:hypothetical protein FB567DRAFT_552056 [Paraphoma chrysanthemicola]
MTPIQSRVVAVRHASSHRVIKRERSSSTGVISHAAPNLEALMEAAISVHAQDGRENSGHAVGVVLGPGTTVYTRAIFDYKAWDSGDATHWREDDIGDEYLRDFTKIMLMFMGHLFVTDDPTPRPITVTLVRNKQGRWIGESVLDITTDLVTTMTEELPSHIMGQIYKWRELEAERSEREKEDWEMMTRDEQLEAREEAVQKREEALQKREEELAAREIRLQEGMQG